MATLSIFVSFEFDRDADLKNSFFAQAQENMPHRVHNSSLNEAYPNEEWKMRAESAIRECDLVIVLVGEDTHSAPGVETEVEIAYGLEKPVFQVIPQKRPYQGLPYVDDRIRWKWNRINRKIDEVWSRSQQG
ncbi:MAG: TIR domain-containing protein [Chloroflexi bacterium]|nr:TIR domain-containing protein [Chloroflexota bacterium]MYE40796.1 TIR domain-containing protein [Chloroflexota bacterium]